MMYFCRMEMSEREREFIKEHLTDDVHRLLLSAAKYPEVDVPFAAEQIAVRRQVREKLPSWYAEDRLVFPSRLSAEQSSSEQTAMYKQRLVRPGVRVCDLTGGLGIDSLFFSRIAGEVTYVERYPEYSEAARYNFGVLGARNIRVVTGEAAAYAAGLAPDVTDIFYIDPARRGAGNKRVYALTECEPDLPALLPVLLQKAPRVIAKLSPMADLRQALALLPGTAEVHVLSVKNECKELLFDIRRGGGPGHDIPVHCWNIRPDGKEEVFVFTTGEEKSCIIRYADSVGNYLFEPNTSVLKAGAFKSITRQGIEKLHPSSHLYTSDNCPEEFPGRAFRVEEVIPYRKSCIKNISRAIPFAHITVRNFPLSVDELRKRTGIKEGGDAYLFATTLAPDDKVVVKTSKL